jgi:hypothetical protein
MTTLLITLYFHIYTFTLHPIDKLMNLPSYSSFVINMSSSMSVERQSYTIYTSFHTILM